MIVLDSNVAIALVIATPLSTAARKVVRGHAGVFALPPLWRSEARSILRKYQRARLVDLAACTQAFERAERRFGAHEREPSARLTLRLAEETGASSYDAEFLAVGEQLGCLVVTNDGPLLAAAPERTVSIKTFG